MTANLDDEMARIEPPLSCWWRGRWGSAGGVVSRRRGSEVGVARRREALRSGCRALPGVTGQAQACAYAARDPAYCWLLPHQAGTASEGSTPRSTAYDERHERSSTSQRAALAVQLAPSERRRAASASHLPGSPRRSERKGAHGVGVELVLHGSHGCCGRVQRGEGKVEREVGRRDGRDVVSSTRVAS